MHLLLIEDDEETATGVARSLLAEDHSVAVAATGSEGLAMLQERSTALLIVDWMLPDIEGVSLIEQARGRGYLGPILMLTALGSIENRVTGLRAGADDYLVKPFATAELIARVEALLRRGSAAQLTGTAGSIRVDRLRREAWREDRRVVLQPREFELLDRLVRQNGKTVSRTMLLEQVWQLHFDPQTNIVETHMSRLRQKLNAGFASDAITTVRGVGYRLNLDA